MRLPPGSLDSCARMVRLDRWSADHGRAVRCAIMPAGRPRQDWAEAVRREEFLTISGTPRAAQRTLTQPPQRWVESHDRGTTPTVLRSCRGESHDPGKATHVIPGTRHSTYHGTKYRKRPSYKRPEPGCSSFVPLCVPERPFVRSGRMGPTDRGALQPCSSSRWYPGFSRESG